LLEGVCAKITPNNEAPTRGANITGPIPGWRCFAWGWRSLREGERVGDQDARGIGRESGEGDDIKTAGRVGYGFCLQITKRGGDETALFLGSDRLQRRSKAGGAAHFDFDETENAAVFCDEIDLSFATPEVALQNEVALGL
jgi:hypothetical protein